ncbi:ffa8be09-dbc6-4133-8fed-5999793a66c9 [Thermothielavioides terrestris]|uniref:Ffa8be09-dbc6-4133-8fed-5999793a66c9 n=1 Tax=Thermothielavioides terrestris TaxID=2587410 RepID=A0A3S4EV29_9PEZI|nr:ffa8be09-dbc6-4133-8fed-5999793a66c9 [Thermothielavioides terrestris]
MATQPLDPAMAKLLGQKYWNHFAIQLGHWNHLKVIIMDEEDFRLMPLPVKVEVAREMGKFLDEDVMFARDADNASVWILGPKKVMRPSITIVDNIPIWDPKKKHVPPPEIKIPRPPNAYILYRKDKHNQVKAENPNLHNNEISVIIGAMWKGESPEVRAKYHQKALQIKAQLMSLHPNYRYAPRKSSEIRRRAPRRVVPFGRPRPFQHNAHRSPEENNMMAGLVPTSEITRRIPGAQQFLPPVETPGWTPYHLVPASMVSTETTPAEATEAEEAPADGDADVNGNQNFTAAVGGFIDDWDIDAQLADIFADI